MFLDQLIDCRQPVEVLMGGKDQCVHSQDNYRLRLLSRSEVRVIYRLPDATIVNELITTSLRQARVLALIFQ